MLHHHQRQQPVAVRPHNNHRQLPMVHQKLNAVVNQRLMFHHHLLQPVNHLHLVKLLKKLKRKSVHAKVKYNKKNLLQPDQHRTMMKIVVRRIANDRLVCYHLISIVLLLVFWRKLNIFLLF